MSNTTATVGNNAGPQVFTVTFQNAEGTNVPAPAGVSFASATPGIDTTEFTPAANADGSYNLTVTPVAIGTDTISVPGLTGDLVLTVADRVAVSVTITPPPAA